MAEVPFTGAPATSFAVRAASSKAPRSFAACCARTTSIAFAVCELSFATFAFFSRAAAASRSSRRSASGLSLSPASAATIMGHGRDGLACNLSILGRSIARPKSRQKWRRPSCNLPPAVPAVPQLAR
eukprot:CAMPEP_0202757238 /NCGR_PEP_ID=MMETSP1388-20130828/16238_1 /ASSEMBLY_ACC=CAM_ASM_000864 /TAXON_ID=37098 /ORGANISM="Isochrysis sp, Strain CCMP1244" /LENGTH=126 /DNA_ID=CAMNT_0049425121 /DNA_START=135 /DNA_END=511 /DNA_ORIENTATION=+